MGLDAVELGQQVALDGLAVLMSEVDVVVEVAHAGLDLLDEHGPDGAVVLAVAAGAHEVRIDHAAAVLGVLDQEARAALAADDGGLEVVVVDVLALAVAVRVQDVLDLVPGGRVGQGLVLAGVLDSLEGHDAAVVGVA